MRSAGSKIDNIIPACEREKLKLYIVQKTPFGAFFILKESVTDSIFQMYNNLNIKQPVHQT